MKEMDELYGGDFPVEFRVFRRNLKTEFIQATPAVMSEPDKKDEVSPEKESVKEESEPPTELAIVDVTPKKFSLRGLRK